MGFEKMLKRNNRNVFGLVSGTVGLAGGSRVLEQMNAPVGFGQGLQGVSGFMPVLGSVAGAKWSLDALKLLNPQQQGKKKKKNLAFW